MVTLVSVVASLVAPLVAAERTASATGESYTLTGTAATDGLSVPQSSSVASAGALASIDPTTGAAAASYPFTLPRARGSVQPTLGLTYSSLAGDGDAGLGWQLGLPSIVRRSPAGLVVPSWHDPPAALQQDWDSYDTYVFDGKPLAPICMVRGQGCAGSTDAFPSAVADGWLHYRLVVDDGSVMRFFLSPDRRTWVVQTKGETFELGAALDGLSADATDVDPFSKLVYRWKLARRYDGAGAAEGLHANLIRYEWNGRRLSDIYDSPVADRGGELAGFVHHVHLWWTDNPHEPLGNHAPMWRQTTDALLTRVDVTSKNALVQGTRELVRSYSLRYSDVSSDVHHARLMGITQVGRCSSPVAEDSAAFTLRADALGCDGLPETTFEYEAPQPLTAPKAVVMENSFNLQQKTAISCDPQGCAPVYPGTEGGGIVDTTVGKEVDGTKISHYAIFDANSDGLPDALIVSGSGVVGPRQTILLNYGSTAFIAPNNVVIPPELTVAFSLADSNHMSPLSAVAGDWYGDGRINIYLPGKAPWYRPQVETSSDQGPSTLPFGVYSLTNGNGLGLEWASTRSGTWECRVQNESDNMIRPSCMPLDIDGDGLTDCLTSQDKWAGDYNGGPNTTPFLGVGTAFATKDRAGKITLPWGNGGNLAPDGNGIALHASSKTNPMLDAFHAYNARSVNRANRYWGVALDTDSLPQYYADMDGDGIVDLIIPHAHDHPDEVDWWRGHGNGWFGELVCKTVNGQEVCDYSDPHSHPTVVIAAPFPMDPDANDLYFHDVNGDGLADLLIAEHGVIQMGASDGGAVDPGTTFGTVGPITYRQGGLHVRFNVDGVRWSDEEVLLLGGEAIPEWVPGGPEHPFDFTQVSFADMNASGVDDVVLIGTEISYVDLMGGQTPNLLTTIHNGLGATQRFTYASSANLPFNAFLAHSTKMPQTVQVVVRLETSNGLVGSAALDQVTHYDYSDPIYDPRARAFRGFRHVKATHDGMGAGSMAPGTIVDTTYAITDCPVHGAQPCSEGVDNVYQAITGLPLVTDTSDEGGTIHHSSVHRGYEMRRVADAMDGRVIRMVYPSQVDTVLYDTSGAFDPADVDSPIVTPDLVATDATDAAKLLEGYQLLPGLTPIYAKTGLAHLRTTVHLDDHGNADRTVNYGRNAAQFIATTGADLPLTTLTTYPQPVGPAGSWMWRPIHQATYGGDTPGPMPDARIRTLGYDPDGNLETVTAILSDTFPLGRNQKNIPVPFAPDPPSQSVDGPIVLYSAHSDSWGNVTHAELAGGQCSDASYDPTHMWPIYTTAYVGRSAKGCGPIALDTFTSFDPGLGVVLGTHGSSNNVSSFSYDGLGRLTAVYEPDESTPGFASTTPSMQRTYLLSPTEGVSRVRTDIVAGQTAVGTGAIGWFKSSWLITDSLGRTLGQFDQTENTPGTLAWVMSGRTRTSPAGAVLQAYLPRFSGENPAQFTGVLGALGLAESYTYDAFGRPTKHVGSDSTTVLEATTYHALSEDTFDGEDLKPNGRHTNTPTTTMRDGFGRTIGVISRSKRAEGALDETTSAISYLPTGEIESVVRSHTGGPDTFIRRMRYDTLGRLVQNFEPNTAAPGEASWTYAYDDAGNLVGTSDARGCGKNIFYDRGGRILAEDFSPCASNQQAYSPPDLNSGDGTEAFYHYDGPEAGQTSSAINVLASVGRLTSVSDRGAQSRVAYDGRGRAVRVERRLALPGDTQSELAARYANHWFAVDSTFDLADHVHTRSTGADAPGFLVNGESSVTTDYSTRGSVSAVTSSYGPLVTRASYDDDGSPAGVVLADAAHTTETFLRDPLRRLYDLKVARAPGPWVTLPPIPPPAEHPLPASGTETCAGEGPASFAAIVAALGDAKTAITAFGAAYPESDAKDIADVIDRTSAGYVSASAWLTTNGLDLSNASAADSTQLSAFTALDDLLTASQKAARDAADHTNADASRAFQALTQAITVAIDLGADGGRCFLDAEEWFSHPGDIPGTTAPTPPSIPTTCAGIGATTLDPLRSLLTSAIAYEQTAMAMHPGEPYNEYPQIGIDIDNDRLQSIATLRASLVTSGLTALDPSTAVAIQNGLATVVTGAAGGAVEAMNAGWLTGPGRNAMEADATAAQYAASLAAAAGRCVIASGVSTTGEAPSDPQSPTNQGILAHDVFEYDLAGNPTFIHDQRTAAEWPAGTKPGDRMIGYDDDYRVTDVDYGASSYDVAHPPLAKVSGAVPAMSLPTRPFWQKYTYDWLGNTTATDDDQHAFYDRSLGTITPSPTAPNQIVSASTAQGSLSAVYDVAGNMTSLTVKRTGTCTATTTGACTHRFDYEWDEIGRLMRARRWDFTDADIVAATGPSPDDTPYPALPTQGAAADLSYQYDAENGRVLKTVNTGTPTYDVEIFPSLRLNRTTFDLGTGDYKNDETTEAVYLSVAGANIARVVYAQEDLPSLASGKLHVLYEITDHLGSVASVVDRDTSELVEHGTYDAYGQEESDYQPDRWKGFREEYRFTGKELDAEVGLTYFGERYYNAAIGRWLTADPLAVHALGADLNPYAYAGGNPFTGVDPTGLETWELSSDPDVELPAGTYQCILGVGAGTPDSTGPSTDGTGSGQGGPSGDPSGPATSGDPNNGQGPTKAPKSGPTTRSQQDRGRTRGEPNRGHQGAGSGGQRYLNSGGAGQSKPGTGDGKTKTPQTFTNPSNGLRRPDYGTFSGSIPIAPIPLLPGAGPVMATPAVTFDRYGHVYVGIGAGLGFGSKTSSVTAVGGWLDTPLGPPPTAGDLSDNLQGWSVAAGATLGAPTMGPSGAINGVYIPSSGRGALEVGGSTSGLGGSLGVQRTWLLR